MTSHLCCDITLRKLMSLFNFCVVLIGWMWRHSNSSKVNLGKRYLWGFRKNSPNVKIEADQLFFVGKQRQVVGEQHSEFWEVIKPLWDVFSLKIILSSSFKPPWAWKIESRALLTGKRSVVTFCNPSFSAGFSMLKINHKSLFWVHFTHSLTSAQGGAWNGPRKKKIS